MVVLEGSRGPLSPLSGRRPQWPRLTSSWREGWGGEGGQGGGALFLCSLTIILSSSFIVVTVFFIIILLILRWGEGYACLFLCFVVLTDVFIYLFKSTPLSIYVFC